MNSPVTDPAVSSQGALPAIAAVLLLAILLLGVAVLAPAGAFAQEKGASGLALPRFVSLGGHEVNLRSGPGLQYPIEWVYRLKGMPVQIVAEYKTWRKVRDWDGDQGWIHQSMLAGKRSFIVTNGPVSMRNSAGEKSSVIARAESGVIGELVSCPGDGTWCRVRADGFDGWLKNSDFWGVLRGETFN